MINIIEKIKREKSAILKVLCLVFLYFGVDTYFNLATDTYATFANGFGTSAIDMFYRNGRPVIALIYEFFYLTGLPTNMFYYISSAVALLFLGIAIWIMQKILQTYSVTENRRILISFISIANIFIIEYFMFVEKCGFMLAILLNIVGVYCITNFYKKGKVRYFIFAIVSVSVAIFTYQGTVALFVLLSLPFAFKHATGFATYVCKIIQIGFVYVSAIILDLCAFKFLFKSARITEKQNLKWNIQYIVNNLKYLQKNTFSILPQHFFSIVLIVVLGISIVLVIFFEKRIGRFLNILVMILACCIFPTATIIQGSGWWALRVVYPIASIIGVIAIDLYVNKKSGLESIQAFKILDKVVLMAIVVLLVGQYFSFNSIYIDRYKLNFADENRANYIGEAIHEYQESSGKKITKVAFYTDESTVHPFYPNLYYGGDLIVSSFYTGWSDITSLNYYLGTSYKRAEQNEKYVEYFSQKDWNTLSQEQLIFDGDTLHVCVY